LSLASDAIVSGLVEFGLFLRLSLFSKGRTEFDDVKLAGIIGLWVGLQRLPMTLCTGVSFGGLTAIFLIVCRLNNLKNALNFASFLCMRTIVGLF